MSTTVQESRARSGVSWSARLIPPAGPGRILYLCSAVAGLGGGLYLSAAAVYFVRHVGLTPGQVGLGLSLAGIASLPLNVPIGHLADRYGPREVTAALAFAKMLLLVGAAFVASFPAYLLVIGLIGVTESGGQVTRSALISGVMSREERVSLSAHLRSVLNAGFTLGTLGGGLALAADTKPAYLSLIWVNAAAMGVATLLYLRLPRVPGVRGDGTAARAERWAALRDLPYIAVAQVAGLGRIGPVIVTVGLPVWLVTRTEAPRPLAAWLLGINTVIVVFLQVWAARGADTVAGAARLQHLTYLVLAAGCLVTAVTSGLSAPLAACALGGAAVLYALGEIWGQSGRWGLRYELAPDDAQGQYGGVFAAGETVAVIVGPVLVTTLPQQLGGPGWALLAGLFAVGLCLTGPSVRWAERTRAKR
ncbi:MFS transporter [Streptomyces sp. NPDC053367]|uniref:MFS transporter n=1 Tax=Streptomyces sp. NPDC053367 TaxID=3365700 RepID=UPI0037CE0C41